jgi:hypothetical protein
VYRELDKGLFLKVERRRQNLGIVFAAETLFKFGKTFQKHVKPNEKE